MDKSDRTILLLLIFAALIGIVGTVIVLNTDGGDSRLPTESTGVRMPGMHEVSGMHGASGRMNRDWGEMSSWMADHPEWMQQHWAEMQAWFDTHPLWMQRHAAEVGRWMRAHPEWMGR